MGMRSGAQAGRWLAILDRLSKSPGGLTAAQLAEEFETNIRTIYRDLEHIQERLGAPLVGGNEDGEGEGAARWHLMEGSRFKPAPVVFTPSEWVALAAATRLMEALLETPSGQCLKTLQAKIKGRVGMLDGEAPLSARSGARSDFRQLSGTIDLLRKAIGGHTTIEMSYTSLSSGSVSRRRLDPYRLWFSEGALYVVGGCHKHDLAPRTFAVDRIHRPKLTDRRFVIPEGFRWEDYVRDSFRVFRGEPTSVVIDFLPAIAPLIRSRTWHESQELKDLPDGGVRLTMKVAGLFEVTTWILGFGAQAKAVSPPALVESVAREIARMGDSYRKRLGKRLRKRLSGSPAPGSRPRSRRRARP